MNTSVRVDVRSLYEVTVMEEVPLPEGYTAWDVVRSPGRDDERFQVFPELRNGEGGGDGTFHDLPADRVLAAIRNERYARGQFGATGARRVREVITPAGETVVIYDTSEFDRRPYGDGIPQRDR
jgi:hypothetical protein